MGRKPAPEPAERNAQGRAKLLAALDHVCPGIVGNPYVPHWPTAPQFLFLRLHLIRPEPDGKVFRALYGGAAGGGKSDALLMAAGQILQDPEANSLVLRRTYADLALPGAIMDRAHSWWAELPGVEWSGETHTFRFPSGARVTFGYLATPRDHERYSGSEFHQTLWDELTQFPLQSQFDFVGLSRVRRRIGCRIPLRTLAASNPGKVGHQWVARMFVGAVDPATGLYVPPKHLYVPARVRDNPHLDAEAYLAGLGELHPTTRAQLENGDWSARQPGDYFRSEWFGPLLTEQEAWPSRDCVRVRWWDLAASEDMEAARTAGVRMARHRSGVRAVEHAVAFRATPGTRDDRIVQVAIADGPAVVQGLEVEPGSGGIAQAEAIRARLRRHGIRVATARPGAETTERGRVYVVRPSGRQSSKETRADPVAACLERGYRRRGEGRDTGAPEWGADLGCPLELQRDGIRLFAGPWTSDYLDELAGFPDVPRCDLVDATSGAWAWLEAHAVFAGPPSTGRTATMPSPTQDQHPEDRERAADRKRRKNP